MSRRREGDVPYEAPKLQEPSFVCAGPCKLEWPLRLQAAGSRRCVNCRRAQKRGALTPEISRRIHLRRKYGTTPEKIVELLEKQGHRCAVCERNIFLPKASGSRNYDAVVDHNHKTGNLRGVLCPRCNTGLGLFTDNPRTLRRAARYLERKLPVSEVIQQVVDAPLPSPPLPTPPPLGPDEERIVTLADALSATDPVEDSKEKTAAIRKWAEEAVAELERDMKYPALRERTWRPGRRKKLHHKRS